MIKFRLAGLSRFQDMLMYHMVALVNDNVSTLAHVKKWGQGVFVTLPVSKGMAEGSPIR